MNILLVTNSISNTPTVSPCESRPPGGILPSSATSSSIPTDLRTSPMVYKVFPMPC
ncbi:hypothetical protein BDW75DRAFT_51652 [Aspergillus navahoensis]